MKKIAKWFEHFDYKWVIVAISFMMVFTVLGFCSSANSIFLKPICEGIDVPRSAYSLTVAFRYVTTSVMNLFFGALIAKFGMKKLIFAGFSCLTVANVIFSFAGGIWGFYIGSIFLGLGFSWTATTMAGAIVSKWCKHNKGTIMGIILAANGIGASVAVQILSPIISSDTFGFRSAYRLTTVIVIAVGAIVLLLFKDKPWHTFPDSPKNKNDKENHKRNPLRSNWSGVPYSDAVRKGYFYGVVVCMFLTRMIQQYIPSVTHYQDLGFSADWVAFVASLASILLTATKILSGFLYDRLGLRVAVTLSYVCSVISQILIITVTNTPTGTVITVIYSILHALALPLDTVMVPIMVCDLFGEHSYAKILGILTAVGTAGTAIGAPITGVCYDIFDSYIPIFVFGLVILAVCAVTIQFTITAGNKERVKGTEIAVK